LPFEMTGTSRFHLTSGILCSLFFLPCREYIQQEDLTKAARKVGEAKKHESKHARPPVVLYGNIVSNFLSSLQPNWMFQHSHRPVFHLPSPYRLLALRCNNQLYDITPLRSREQTTTLTHI
jgi:hypothetical protein